MNEVRDQGPDRWRTVSVVDTNPQARKGQATNSIKSAPEERPVIERTLRSGDSWEWRTWKRGNAVPYSDGEFWTFMDPKTFEQIQAAARR